MNTLKHRVAALVLALPLSALGPFCEIGFAANGEVIWRGSANEFFKYADQDDSHFGRNDHPVDLNSGQIETVLGSLRIRGKDAAAPEKELDPVFTAEQAEMLGKYLAKGLLSARPDQDVIFALIKSKKRGPVLKPSQYFVAGRAFYRDAKLNIIIGDYDRFRDTAYETAYDPTKMGIFHYSFDFGSRFKSSTGFQKSVLTFSGVDNMQLNGVRRDDWLVIDVTAALAAYDQQATMRKRQEVERKRKEIMEIMGTEETMPSPVPAAPVAAPAPVRRGISWKELEEGLTTLNRLRERGLITDEDYEAKKKQMLDALGTW